MPRALNGKKSEPDIIERREQDILDRRADAAWEYRSRNREAVNARARLRMRRRREELQTAPAAVRLEKEAKARQYRRNYRERNRPVPRPVKSASPTKAAKTSETRTKTSKATTTDYAKSSHASRDETPALRRSERGLFDVGPYRAGPRTIGGLDEARTPITLGPREGSAGRFRLASPPRRAWARPTPRTPPSPTPREGKGKGRAPRTLADIAASDSD
ncbi:hypothetical protein DFH06DRAFT_1325356 [Mycena polygramma]|nr:hypothetical protein DFH06DRAFT_1325356 [Mycena polygramma]